MDDSFDLVVLGSGAGGSAPASQCRAAGWRVAIVDDKPYGGTCALRGCDPKKVLVGAADVLAWHNHMRGHGLAGDANIDWPALMRFKRTFTDPVPVKREAALAQAGIEIFHGEAHFAAEDRLAVGDRELTSRHIVIAAGAGPRQLGIPGEDLVISSTQFLELDSLPPRIVFVGAGYISLEFAHIARRAGAEITILGRSSPLPGFDEALVERLLAHSRDIGIDVRLGSEVIEVKREGSSDIFRVHTRDENRTFDAELVVHGAGRVPNTATLGAAAGNVRLGQDGAVEVNEFLQSPTNPRVYAAGDVALPPGSLPLTPVASHEGAVVASNLLHGNHKRPDYRGVPSVVFTLPHLAAVGLTENAARAQGFNVRVQADDTTNWFSNRRVRETVGMFKTIVDSDTDEVLGAHLLGGHADEVINLFAFAIRFGVSAKDLKHMIYASPTSASELQYML